MGPGPGHGPSVASLSRMVCLASVRHSVELPLLQRAPLVASKCGLQLLWTFGVMPFCTQTRDSARLRVAGLRIGFRFEFPKPNTATPYTLEALSRLRDVTRCLVAPEFRSRKPCDPSGSFKGALKGE